MNIFSSETLYFLGLYFNFNLILVLISIILTILVLNCQFRGPKQQRVPKWMRKYIIGYLGKFFCFSNESRAYNFKSSNNNDEVLKQIDNENGPKSVSTKILLKNQPQTDSDSDNDVIKNFKGKNFQLNEVIVNERHKFSNFFTIFFYLIAFSTFNFDLS